MAEIIRYRNQNVSLGTCEYLYYVSYQKYRAAYDSGYLHRLEGNLPPQEYLDTTNGFMFRFPFPDEDKLGFGEIKAPFDREIPIRITKEVFDKMQGGDHKPADCYMSIAYQKPVIRRSDGRYCLALIYRDGATGGLYRSEEEHEVKKLVREIVKHHIANEPDADKKSFYRHLAARIIRGYHMDNARQLYKEAVKSQGRGSGTKNIEKKRGRKIR